jgi:hypothetical protein
MPPGSYFHNENQKPATIAVNKAGQGVVDQTASKTAKKSTQHVRSAKKNSTTFGYTSARHAPRRPLEDV